MAAGTENPMAAGLVATMAEMNPGMGRQAESWLVTALQERGSDVSLMWKEGTPQSRLPCQEGHEEALIRQRPRIW